MLKYFRMRYSTKQRQEILDLIKGHGESHVSVETLLSDISKKQLNISRATLYRTLDSLTEEGIIKRFFLDGKLGACYQLCEEEDHNHFHLICESCGKMLHLDCDEVESLMGHIEKEHNFKVNSDRVVLYGICEDCRSKK